MGLKALRVAAAVRKEHGNDGLAKIYTNMGTRYHHDEEDIDTPENLEEILQAGGFPTRLAKAATQPEWDKLIQADMDHALAKVGKDVGVPLIVLDGGDGPGFFGPVCSPAPTGSTMRITFGSAARLPRILTARYPSWQHQPDRPARNLLRNLLRPTGVTWIG